MTVLEITPTDLFEKIGRLVVENEKLHAHVDELEAQLAPQEEPEEAEEPASSTI